MELCDELEMPPGFRFHPTAEEIIIHYLLNKVIDTRFVSLPIHEVVDLNNCEPWDLPKKAKMGENEWFFFYQKDRKYASGKRTNRATKLGYWKATGKDREIYNKGKKSCLVGMKKTLVFYKGRAPKGDRTNWVMHEYRLEGNFPDHNLSKTAKEEWVVCRVFDKKKSSTGVEVAKVEPNVDVISPTLPPLTDYSFSSERISTKVEQEFEAIKNYNMNLQQNNNNLFTSSDPYWDPTPFYTQNVASNNTAGEERMCKMGTFSSFDNSIISPSHAHDSVKPYSDELFFSPSIPDLDSLWSQLP